MATCAVASACGSPAAPATANGAAVFAADCSACHSLIGNESEHKQGGDLVGYAFSRPVLVQYAREMPTRRPLGPAQLQAVVGYVLRAEGRREHSLGLVSR